MTSEIFGEICFIFDVPLTIIFEFLILSEVVRSKTPDVYSWDGRIKHD